MTAFVVILRERTTDPSELELYREQAPQARAGHGWLGYLGDGLPLWVMGGVAVVMLSLVPFLKPDREAKAHP